MGKYVLCKTIAGIPNGQVLEMSVAGANPFAPGPGEFTLEVQDPTGLDPTPPITNEARYITLTNLVAGPGPGSAEIMDMTPAEMLLVDDDVLDAYKAEMDAEADLIDDFAKSIRLISIMTPAAITGKTTAMKASMNAQLNMPDVSGKAKGIDRNGIRARNRFFPEYIDRDPRSVHDLFFEMLHYYGL